MIHEPAARHWTTTDWQSMEWDPELSAAQIEMHAPETFAAVVAAYCARLDDDDAGKYRGRHVETAAVNGGYL